MPSDVPRAYDELFDVARGRLDVEKSRREIGSQQRPISCGLNSQGSVDVAVAQGAAEASQLEQPAAALEL